MATPYRYLRKLMHIGNSFVVSLPVIWIKANKVKKGSEVMVEVYEDRVVISQSSKKDDRRK